MPKEMKDMRGMNELEFVLSIIQLVLRYGIPTAVKIIKAWKMPEEPTLEDIRKLRELVPPPEEYFKK